MIFCGVVWCRLVSSGLEKNDTDGFLFAVVPTWAKPYAR